MSSPEHPSSYLAASKHLANGQPREALQLLVKIPAPASEEPEVQLALARCYVALDRHNAAFRIVSALQAAHGPGPWSGLMQELFAQPAEAATAAAAAAAESVPRPVSRSRLPLLLSALTLLSVTVAAAFWLGSVWIAEQEVAPKEAGSFQVSLTRPLVPEEVLSAMSVDSHVDAVYFALLPGLVETDVPALRLVLSEAMLPEARERAVWLLGALRDESIADALIASAQTDTSGGVRRASVAMLRNFNNEPSWRTLERLLKHDPEQEVRWLAAASMSHLRDRAAQHYIEEAAAREESPYGKAMLQRLVSPEARGTRPPLIRAGESSSGAFRDTPYRFYVPTSFREGKPLPLLVTLPSGQGDAESMLEVCKPEAEANACALLVPCFDYGDFPYYRHLNLVPTLDSVSQRLAEIIAAVGERITLDEKPPLLFGYGEGAEVASRFALAHPGEVWRMALHGAGSYVYPDAAQPFPMGLAPNPLYPNLPPLTFDTIVDTPTLLIHRANDSETSTREALRFLRAAQKYASEADRSCRVEGREIPGDVLVLADVFPVAVEFLLSGP